MNLITVRDTFWHYPYHIFIGKKSLFGRFFYYYQNSRPFSHIAFTAIVAGLLGILLFNNFEVVLGFNKNTYVEGVIVGTTPSGTPQGPNRLNPMQISNSRLDKDIIELIYEPLIRVNQQGEPIPVIAENYAPEEDSKSDQSYRFKIREDVYWHDGKKLTTKDIEATFQLIKEFGENNFPDIYASEAAKDIELTVLDDYVCKFTVAEGKVLPNFFEILTFKILPSHELKQYREAVVSGQYTGEGTLKSIGTGPYILSEVTPAEVRLHANPQYHHGEPNIDKFVFKLLRNNEEAIKAVKSGQVHGIANMTGEVVEEAEAIDNMRLVFSNVIYTQYWGLYFNLDKDQGPKELRSKPVRKAFSMAINRELAIQSSILEAEVALGPIPSNSPYYVKGAQQPSFDRDAALKALGEDGWKLTDYTTKSGQQVKLNKKDDQELRFTLSYVDNPDRTKLVSALMHDLERVGIIVEPLPLQPRELAQARVSKDFDLLLFGVSTFIDPDRYEYFHSSQIIGPGNNGGLNIGSYKSEKTTTVIDEKEKKTVQIPVVDKVLDEGRKLTSVNSRKEEYQEFQEVVADEVPLIFLYHPKTRYLVNKRVKNISLENLSALENRFANVYDWKIEFE